MGLYPNILFHFTSKVNLRNILKETFKLSYAREKIVGKTITKEFGVPMVSFSDLRLSELKEHIANYDKFGIGMTKEWAFSEGLNPVLYLSSKSHFTDNFINAFTGIFELIESSNLLNFQPYYDYQNLFNIYGYLKNYEGELKRPEKKTIPNYRFANEREWRYIPPTNLIEPSQLFLPINKIRTKELKRIANEQISHLSLSFQPDDINYLIVEKESDINDLIDHISDAKNNRFNAATLERLKSRILTTDQIFNDI